MAEFQPSPATAVTDDETEGVTVDQRIQAFEKIGSAASERAPVIEAPVTVSDFNSLLDLFRGRAPALDPQVPADGLMQPAVDITVDLSMLLDEIMRVEAWYNSNATRVLSDLEDLSDSLKVVDQFDTEELTKRYAEEVEKLDTRLLAVLKVVDQFDTKVASVKARLEEVTKKARELELE